MNSTKVTRYFIYLLITVALIAILWSYNSAEPASIDLSITELAEQIRANQIESLTVNRANQEVKAIYHTDTAPGRVQIGGTSLLEELSYLGITADQLQTNNITITYQKPNPFSNLLIPLSFLIPTLLMFALFYFIFRQTQSNNNQATAFGKSKARLFTGDHPTISFTDIAGCDEAKEELQEVVEFLKEPEKFISFGARIPKGVLLIGAPGTGKTLLAKAVSGEAGVPFFSIAGSEFVEMFVGVGASRVRDLFEQARRHSPCIIFVDEIDAVGRQRGAGLGGSHDEREQTLNQILVEMDGFGTDTHVIILAATNRPDILDKALTRPGRFDRRVIIDKPDVRGREAIFNIHLRGKPLSTNVQPLTLAKATPGFVGADIENTVNEAALMSARRNRKNITMHELQEAIERVQLGPERRSRLISPEEKEITAYHEAGHAVVAHLIPHADPLRKVTIIPRGMAGGVTWFLSNDTLTITASKIRAHIAVALGGRVAEHLTFGEITTGASADLRQITRLARAMITEYGMSHSLGLRVYGKKQEMVFLGREISQQRDYSDAVAQQIDEEVRLIIDNEHERVTQLLTDHRHKLDLIAQRLLEIETLEADEFTALMEGQTPPPITPATPSPIPSPDTNPAPGRVTWPKPPTTHLPPTPSPA